jgi:hypothetical protein
VLIAHLSDLHLKTQADIAWLGRQLDRILARRFVHLAITGDILDRWNPPLFEDVLDALQVRGLMEADRLTILHGNHDLASSGGHPQRGTDLWRLALGFWDPPPVIASRRLKFYEAVQRRASGIAAPGPYEKTLRSGFRIVVLDSVPAFWRPIGIRRRTLVLRHAIGAIGSAQLRLLADEAPAGTVRVETAGAERQPAIVLMHHYPLDAPSYQWSPDPRSKIPIRRVRVPTAIPAADRERFWTAAVAADARLVLCGHVHRARLEHHRGIAVGLNGQSGAAWASRPIAWYELGTEGVALELETLG